MSDAAEHVHEHTIDLGVQDYGRYDVRGCACGDEITIERKPEEDR